MLSLCVVTCDDRSDAEVAEEEFEISIFMSMGGVGGYANPEKKIALKLNIERLLCLIFEVFELLNAKIFL